MADRSAPGGCSTGSSTTPPPALLHGIVGQLIGGLELRARIGRQPRVFTEAEIALVRELVAAGAGITTIRTRLRCGWPPLLRLLISVGRQDHCRPAWFARAVELHHKPHTNVEVAALISEEFGIPVKAKAWSVDYQFQVAGIERSGALAARPRPPRRPPGPPPAFGADEAEVNRAIETARTRRLDAMDAARARRLACDPHAAQWLARTRDLEARIQGAP